MSLRATLSSAAAISLLIGFLSVAIATEPEIDVIFPGVPIEGEQLGWELSADGSLLAVAAPPWIEAVYVFAKDGSGWAQEARLTPPIGTAPSSRFGTAIAISTDTLVIGAPGDDPNASPNSLGAAFVYKRSNGAWSLTNKLVPAGPLPDFVTGVTFGASVAIDGDNLLVGAPGVDFDRTFVNVGAVYPYRFDGNSWVEQPRIDLFDFTGSNSGFGTSIALDGSTAVVTNVGLAGFSRRVALVYEFDGRSWIRTDVLQASDAADRWDLRGAADISANRMILRGFRNPTGERSTAAAYLFGKNGSGWEELQKLEADGTEVITASGTPHVDVDDVVILDAVIVISGRISVSNVVGGSTYDGGAFVFETDDGLSWNQTRFLRSTNVITVGPSSGFGSSVAITESDILVGAPGDDTQIADGGAVYVFSGPPPITDEISITPTQLDFGAVVLGQSAQQSLAVQNLSNSSITVSVSIAPPFSVAPSGEIPIGAGETALVNVHFAPTSTGSATGTLTFSTIQRSIDVPLSGEGVAPAQPVVDVSSNVLSFPDTVIGTLSQPIEIIVTNVGDAELTVAAVDIFGNSEDFAIGTVDCTQANVPPRASCTLSFAFSPAGSGNRIAEAAVVSNAANAPTLISLEGNGLEPVPIANVQPTGIDFEGTYLGEVSGPAQFTVRNSGGAELVLGGAGLVGANLEQFEITSDGCSGLILPANTSCVIEVSFVPTVSGGASADLFVPTNSGDGLILAALTGVGLSSEAFQCSRLGWLLTKSRCKLLDAMRSPEYFNIDRALVSDDVLYQFIKENGKGLEMLVLQIDNGWDIQDFVVAPYSVGLAIDSDWFKSLNDATDAILINRLLAVVLTALDGISGATLTAVDTSLSSLDKLTEAIKVFRRFVIAIDARPLRVTLDAYFQQRRSGATPDNAWLTMSSDIIYEEYVTLIANLNDLTPAELGIWYEHAYSAYLLVGYPESQRVREEIGIGIAAKANGL